MFPNNFVTHQGFSTQELGGGPDADELRAEPLGRDARGARYFFLAVGQEDCRLYREEPPPRARRGRKPSGRGDAPKWAVACSSIEVRAARRASPFREASCIGAASVARPSLTHARRGWAAGSGARQPGSCEAIRHLLWPGQLDRPPVWSSTSMTNVVRTLPTVSDLSFRRPAPLQEITELTERLSGSRNKAERALRDAICDGMLPGLLDSVAARKRASERLAAIEAAPRKRSSRLQVSNVKQLGGCMRHHASL